MKSTKKAPKLEFGQTPWDDLSRDSLLREVQRMYAAISSLESTLSMQKANGDPESPFWGYKGTGGIALEMARQITDPIKENYSSENVYRSFFRYAVDLLFDPSTGYEIGFNWVVCPKCGVMVGRSAQGDPAIGSPCNYPGSVNCDGAFRLLEWGDLEPKPSI